MSKIDPITEQDPISTATAVGAALNGQKAVAGARNAKLAADAIAASHARQFGDAACQSEFLKDRAGQIAEQTITGVRSAGREQVKGHFIEAMTVRDYNLGGKLTGKELQLMPNPTHRAYDARRFIDGQFAGGMQIKSGANGTYKTATGMNKVKAGSATRGTMMTSSDQVAEAGKMANGKVRVKSNGVTLAQSERRLDQGIKKVAADGSAAGSAAKAAGKAGLTGAAINTAIGAARDAKALKNGELSGRHFTENRAIDASEGAVSGVLGAGAAAAAGGATTVALGTAAGASVAASAGAAGTAAVGAIGGMGAGGTAVAGVLAGVSAPVALPFVAGAVAATGVGIGVAKVAGKLRKAVKASREEDVIEPQPQLIPGLAASFAEKRRRQLEQVQPTTDLTQQPGGITFYGSDGTVVELPGRAA